MSDIKELTRWCEDARDLLGYAILFNESSKSMKTATAAVSEGLQQLAKMASQTTLSTPFLTEYETLATRARDLKAQTTGDPTAETKRIEDIKAVSSKLAVLGQHIQAALPLAQAQDAYQVRLKHCERLHANFASQPLADPATTQAVIDKAKGLAAQETDIKALNEATKALNSFEGVLKSAQTAQKAAAEKMQRQHAAMAGCNASYADLEALLDYVKTEGIGLTVEREKLTKGLDEAKACIEGKDWLGAQGILSKLPKRAECNKASEAALKKVSDQNPSVQTAKNALAELDTLVDAGMAAEFTQKLHSAINAVAQADADNVKVAHSNLSATEALIQIRLSWARSHSEKLKQDLRELGDRVKGIGLVAPSIEVQRMRDALERVTTRASQKQIVEAQDMAQALRVQMEQALTLWSQRKDSWTKIEPSLKRLQTDLEEQAQDSAAPPDLCEAAKRQSIRLSDTKVLVEARDWPALLALHDSAQATWASFGARKAAFADFAKTRVVAELKVKDREKALNTHLTTLRKALTASRLNPDEPTDALAQELSAIDSVWKQKLANATSEAELDLDATLAALESLRKDAEAAATAQSLAATRREQEQHQLRTDFDTARAELADSLATLDTLDARQAKALRARAAKIEADAGQPLDTRLSALRAVARDVVSASTAAQAERNTLNTDMLTRCQVLKDAIEAQWTAMKSGTGKQFEAMFQAMRDELEDLSLLAGTPNLAAAKANAVALGALEGRLQDLLAQSAAGQDPFKGVVDELARLKRDVTAAQSDLKKNVPKTEATLQKRLIALEQALYAMDVAQAHGELAQLRVALDQALGEANQKEVFRASITQLVPVLESNLALMKTDARTPDYHRALSGRFEAARKLAATPDKLNQAKQEMDRILQDVQSAILDPQTALNKQRVLLADQQRQTLLVAEWTSARQVFKARTLPRAVAAVGAPGADPSQVAEIERMVALAEESAKAGDHPDALHRLKLAAQRAEEVVNDPSGPGIGSRKALPQDAEQYREAAQGLLRALETFPDQVAKKVPETAPQVLKHISDQTTGLRDLFDPAAFDSYAVRLSDGKADARLRRESRELALQKLRDLRILLVGHPVLVGLLVNPISADLPVAAKTLNQRLNRLEANIRRSVH